MPHLLILHANSALLASREPEIMIVSQENDEPFLFR